MSIVDDPKYDSASGRRYRYPGKKVGYLGVTSLIGNAWPSEHLENWRIGNIAKNCVTHSKEVAKKFKHISKKPDKIKHMYAQGVKDLFLDWKEDNTASSRGTRIHEALEAYFLDEPIPKATEQDERATMRSAITCLESINFICEYVEAPIYNHTLKYAGTADLIGTFEVKLGKKRKRLRAVIDLKTGKRISRSYLPQLAAYAMAEEVMFDVGHKTKVRSMPKIHRAFVLHALPHKAVLYRVDIELGWAIFQACHTVSTQATATKGIELYVHN